MGKVTSISWTDHTFNPWVGCTKVSAACDRCYAETWARRSGHSELWNGERRRTAASNWHQPLKWNRAAEQAGERRRVFCASLADVFDNQIPVEWRRDLFALILATGSLDWLLLTKRPQNAREMIGDAVAASQGKLRNWPWPNVWLGTTTENQPEFDRRWPFLSDIEAIVRFISYEPALGPLTMKDCYRALPDWVICGGESGSGHRPMRIEWATTIRDECVDSGVAFHFKQWGGNRPKDGGRLLHGREWLEIPR